MHYEVPTVLHCVNANNNACALQAMLLFTTVQPSTHLFGYSDKFTTAKTVTVLSPADDSLQSFEYKWNQIGTARRMHLSQLAKTMQTSPLPKTATQEYVFFFCFFLPYRIRFITYSFPPSPVLGLQILSRLATYSFYYLSICNCRIKASGGA